ncbi:hypothetical protein SLS55_001278 [Diplodia seriata]|uniref:DUF7580 domain-containing protein n=1 Tax=Diplodia seriata TaxID=420778 RepID=A0ABR3CWQ6_9PEZI
MPVLQLYNTPWLKDDWTLEDVYTHSGGSFQLFITPDFDQASDGLQTVCRAKQQICVVKNSTIFALGVALLELSYGQDISCFRTPSDLDDSQCEHALTRFMIADRLTREVQQTEFRGFANAVAKCICPASDSYNFSLSNEGFRRRFYEDVVMRLKEEHDYLFEDTAPRY